MVKFYRKVFSLKIFTKNAMYSEKHTAVRKISSMCGRYEIFELGWKYYKEQWPLWNILLVSKTLSGPVPLAVSWTGELHSAPKALKCYLGFFLSFSHPDCEKYEDMFLVVMLYDFSNLIVERIIMNWGLFLLSITSIFSGKNNLR